MLRSTEQTIGKHDSDKLRNRALNFGFTKKVLNSGLDFEVPDVVPEGFEKESAFTHDKLWVEKYAPHAYTDLISDEVLPFFFDMVGPFLSKSCDFSSELC